MADQYRGPLPNHITIFLQNVFFSFLSPAQRPPEHVIPSAAGARDLLLRSLAPRALATLRTPTTRALPFLPKPWTLHELLAAVRGVLPQGGGS